MVHHDVPQHAVFGAGTRNVLSSYGVNNMALSSVSTRHELDQLQNSYLNPTTSPRWLLLLYHEQGSCT